MDNTDKLKRYQLFGWDYETVSKLTDAEYEWHLMWAWRTSGPILGLACGTGRLLCRLAGAGFDVVGLDLSKTMLSLARKNIQNLRPAARSRIRLIKGDMSDFNLGEKFGLIVIADNSFRELPTRSRLLACLRCIRRHLRKDGKLLITERRFDPTLYVNGVRSFGWSNPQPHPETDELISRRGEIRPSRSRKRISGKFVYRITHNNGNQTFEECPWSAPLLSKQEYINLFQRAGFTAQTFTNYNESQDNDQEPILCFVCETK